jgi:hypothetical protein
VSRDFESELTKTEYWPYTARPFPANQTTNAVLPAQFTLLV